MNNNDEKNELQKEYEEFLSFNSNPVPDDVSEKILNDIKKLINPSAWLVFIKLMGFQLVIGLFSMAVCHQFEMNPFRTTASLSDWLMSVGGHSFCMIGCGLFFVGISFMAAGYFMTVEEVRAIKRNETLHIFSVGVVSLSIFALFGAQLVLTFAGLWLLGAIIGGFLATEAVFRFKTI